VALIKSLSPTALVVLALSHQVKSTNGFILGMDYSTGVKVSLIFSCIRSISFFLFTGTFLPKIDL
jgi:hypothetical protein